MINVIVAQKRNINITINSTANVITSSTPVTLKNISTKEGRIDQLLDVNAINETDGATLVYDSSIDKYIVEKLDLTNTVGPLDGGNF